ncbi:DUF21 domain-containing protein At4g14240 isoform X4 [Vigna angularis]|uniref:DUF21 domain-containing protein At4g14240 isoform X4 n=1 Tax=Phaseolus angularis TaxID=3914 RepID=UPI0022B3429D|nr:DUF21 domain-containing protein At4g14240 isoform X4 [Vigna angularis]
MNVVSALMVTQDQLGEPEGTPFGSVWWFVYAGISCFLVIFAGIMSGLTLGLMSLGLVDLEILQRSGSPSEKKQAAVILPVVQKQHQLLVTLLLCNAAAMEALPIYLDKMFNQFVAIILSVTFVLFFGEVIPQSICSRYGLAVGANFVWLVRILMIICYPVAYPIGKVLDRLLGHDEALFRRAQLKALVSIHSKEAGKGGELTHDETTIISGALDLTEKTAEEAMTPIESTFSLDVNSKLDWEAMGKILARGHSRVPVYSGNPKNIIGLLLDDEKTESVVVDIHKFSRPPSINKSTSLQRSDATTNGSFSDNMDDGEVIGIITLEDVFEELLQEEIVDETDEYVDVHKRIRVAAAAAASSVARAPSIRRSTGQKGAGSQSKTGLTVKKSAEDDGSNTRPQ